MSDPQDDQHQTPPLINPRPQRPSLFASLRNNFFTGIVVAAPIGITVALVYWFITGPMAQLDGFVRHWIPIQINPEESLKVYIPGLGVLVAVVALIVLGALAKNFLGRSVLRVGERLVDSMPVIRNLYRFFKNVFETALQQSSQSFKEMAIIEYPRTGVWALAFVVAETRGEVTHQVGKDLVSVFVPTTPNPTSGFLLFVPQEQVVRLAMSVEEGAKMIFSAGLVTPDFATAEDAVAAVETAATTARDEERKPGLFSRVLGRHAGNDAEEKEKEQDRSKSATDQNRATKSSRAE